MIKVSCYHGVVSADIADQPIPYTLTPAGDRAARGETTPKGPAMNEQDTSHDTQGRTVSVVVYGKDLPSLEMAALDNAREFFGPDMRLEIIPDYCASQSISTKPGRQFSAQVHVREVRPQP